MYCPNCGKQIKEYDNFCRFCGTDLRENDFEKCQENTENSQSNDEEFVLYDVKKHWMSLFWSAFFTPVFILYFWNIFLNTHSFFSWVVVFVLLGLIFYPIARYKSDRLIITNKFAHIKIGVLNPEEKDIPVKDLNSVTVTQSSMGRMFDYGFVLFNSLGRTINYGYIDSPEDLQCIIDDPCGFINDALKEDEMTV